jgi:hypothetical protein
MHKSCKNCKDKVDLWNKECAGCGYKLVLEPEEEIKKRYLKTPSLGALLFTQGWTFGARLYFWFILSLIPAIGIAALVLCVMFGRRWSWKHGGWSSWEAFQERMRLMDFLGVMWITFLGIFYIIARFI